MGLDLNHQSNDKDLQKATHNGESIQPYYRHQNKPTTDFLERKAQEFLRNMEEAFPILTLDQIISKKDINHPSPDAFFPILEGHILELEEVDAPDPPQPHATRKKWTKEEDITLFSNMRTGARWGYIASQLPGRSVSSIRSRTSKKEFARNVYWHFQQPVNPT